MATAHALLERYVPQTSLQHVARARMLALIEAHPHDAHLRSALEGHLTASALLLDSRFKRALLTHHKKLGRWLQLGGHCDGDANLAAVALRECTEESGIAGLRVLPLIIDLDIHPIPGRLAEPEHFHYDARFIVLAPVGAREVLSDESHALRWFTPDELEGVEVDESVRRLFEVGFGHFPHG